MERISSSPERGMTGSSSTDDDLSRLGHLVDGPTLRIDLRSMFNRDNYPAFLTQHYNDCFNDWTGVKLACDEPYVGEFAAIFEYYGLEAATNLSFAGMFKDMFGKPNLLLAVADGEDKEVLHPDAEQDSMLYFLICDLDAQDPDANVVVQSMAIMNDRYCNDEMNLASAHVAYHLLYGAYLKSLL